LRDSKREKGKRASSLKEKRGINKTTEEKGERGEKIRIKDAEQKS